MKIACIGNMNHIFFSLVRFLRDRGVDAHLLLVDDEFAHFHPRHDSVDESYTAYCHQLGWGSARSFYRVSARRVRHDLAPYDGMIGCGFAPAFCEKIGRPLDVFVPYGSDLYYFPFGLSRTHWLKRLPAAHVSRRQRRGIERARHVYCLDFYAPYREALRRLGVPYERVACTPIYYPQYDRLGSPEHRRTLAMADRFDALRERLGFLLFSHTRHSWTRSQTMGWTKGNDVLIEGFAHYLRESGRVDVGLVLCEHGDDVEASRALCRQLCVEEHVHWFPQLPRREVMYGALQADAGADQFPEEVNGGVYGGCGIELMSIGKPLFGRFWFTPEEFQAGAGFPMPPLVNVLTPKDLASRLADLVEHPEQTAMTGQQTRAWAREHYGAPLAARYLEAFGGAAS